MCDTNNDTVRKAHTNTALFPWATFQAGLCKMKTVGCLFSENAYSSVKIMFSSDEGNK